MTSVPISDDDLMAYADGQLANERREAVEQALARDPALGVRVASIREQNAALRDALDPWLAEAIPPRLIAAAEGRAGGGRLLRTWPALAAAATLEQALAEPAESRPPQHGAGVDPTVELLLAERDAATRSADHAANTERLTASTFHEFIENPAEAERRRIRPVPMRPYRRTRTGNRFHEWVERRATTSLGTAVPLWELDPETDDLSRLEFDAEPELQPLIEQFESSACSAGANAKEAQNAESLKDFIHKMKIELKEADEAEYWYFVIAATHDRGTDLELIARIQRVIRILNKIVSTSKQRLLARKSTSSTSSSAPPTR